ncbi:M23 family metallopeptidase [Streptomyces sp. NPDC057638]|uniref:M23 family metallopeptidase n=1 Tax=Streptomyces sp. NPDC057638 TaxID=3346190 RepID=UPI0036B6BBBD
MNDQHAHAGYVGHDGYPTGSFDTDPLFGNLPDGDATAGGYDTGHSGPYDSSPWDTGSHHTTGTAYGLYPEQQPAAFPSYDHDGYENETPAYATETHAGIGQTPAYDGTGQWDASAWNQTGQQFEATAASFTYDTTGQWAVPAFETGAYDATAWNTGATETVGQSLPGEQELTAHATEFGTELGELSQEFTSGANGYPMDPAHDGLAPETAAAAEYAADGYAPEPGYDLGAPGELGDTGVLEGVAEAIAVPDTGELSDTGTLIAVDTDHEPHDVYDAYETDSGSDADDVHDITPVAPVTPRPVRRAGNGGSGSRGRRRTPAKRSALLTVAVPSACVMGVAGIAAASVGGIGADKTAKKDTTNLAAADVPSAKSAAANSRMDTQLAALSAEARDFGDRASRTQERLDLQARQEAERQKREAEAKRREALRPKFALPVQQKGLSTYYGQSGVNWMTVHTGIDFPVPYGAEIYAATDGTIRTQWNNAYGNMIILTAPDGTETWYCHLSSAKIRSGKVKAGEVIGYAGNSGNSTGPHLHFEVRPGGGSHINPLAWLQSKGLNPL